MAHNEEWANKDIHMINKTLKVMDNNQDKDISYMEDEGEQDIEIDDRSIEGNMVDNEDTL